MAEYAVITLDGITPSVRQTKWEGNILANPLEAVWKDRTVHAPVIGILGGERQTSHTGEPILFANPPEAVHEDKTVHAPVISIIGGERIYSHTGETITSSIVINGATEIRGPRKWPLEIAWKHAMTEK